MRTKFLALPLLLASVFIVFTSCSSDDGTSDDQGLNPENEKMIGTKWTATNWDYGIGDDWVSTIDETCNIYFYSNTEGYWNKEIV